MRMLVSTIGAAASCPSSTARLLLPFSNHLGPVFPSQEIDFPFETRQPSVTGPQSPCNATFLNHFEGENRHSASPRT